LALQIPNYRGGKRREEVIDRPHTWEEVVFKCVPLQEGEEDMNEVSARRNHSLSNVPRNASCHHLS
jgi:hypothetical protein